MFFALKKFVAFWPMPLPFCLTLLIVGLGLMLATRRARLGRACALAGIGLLMLFSNHFVSRWLVRPIETRYPAMPEFAAGQPIPRELAACRFVVVLGGGNGYSRGVPATAELSLSALARITEAVRLLRVLPDAKLIVSGPGDGKHAAHATVLARAAISLGIDEQRITLIDQALDTEDEARIVRERVGDAPFALVTSAWHLPRAVALFRHEGLAPLPCPADFFSHEEESPMFSHYLCDSTSLNASTVAVHERIGYLWIWLRGRG
ncbi:MAG TPA: ElyC/SanA/YdcF family protein [Opitutaceae bacterium]|nr:ElyC/SanA/YdcF family protein [Opitutaceae bacterium]